MEQQRIIPTWEQRILPIWIMETENSSHLKTEFSPHWNREFPPHWNREFSPHGNREFSPHRNREFPPDGAQLICTGYRVQGFKPQVSKLTASSKCHPLRFILISEMPHEYHQSDLDDESDCDGARGRHDLCTVLDQCNEDWHQRLSIELK